MEDTQQFVNKLQDEQQKQQHNRKNGKGSPSNRLQNKQHSTNK